MMIEKDYNTERGDLIIAEYGRNVQKMVEYALTIEDRNHRTRVAHGIVSVMQMLSPNTDTAEDYYLKIWNHINIISGYKLDIDFPVPVEPKEVHDQKPQAIPYHNSRMKYKFYGENIEFLLNDIAKLEEGDKKNALALAVANQMKTMYITWNREIATDSVIKNHISEITGNKIIFQDGVSFVSAAEVLRIIKQNEEAAKLANSKGGSRKGQSQQIKKQNQPQNQQYKNKRK